MITKKPDSKKSARFANQKPKIEEPELATPPEYDHDEPLLSHEQAIE